MESNYINDALRTLSSEYTSISSRVEEPYIIDLLHSSMGLATESGEFLDVLKKHIFYGKTIDEVNLKEELGDLMWYMAIAMNALGTNFEDEARRNIEKLRARYPEKFTESNAINRNIDLEYKILSE